MKNLHFITFIAALGFLLSIPATLLAQYQGPGNGGGTYTVKEIKANEAKLDRLDALVKVQGFIVKQINANTYEFRDKEGTMQVKIDKKRLPEIPFNDKTELIIIGEIDYDIFEPLELEVKEILFVSPAQ